MRPNRLLLAVLLSLAGCQRDFPGATPKPQPLPIALGQSCAVDDDCQSLICEQKTCCASVCGPAERCNDPENRGTCTVRKFGTACANDLECGSGFCADGVCCSSRCGGPCERCDFVGRQGTCTGAPDGTDPRGQLPACQECRDGKQAATAVASDPRNACGDGKACGLGTGSVPVCLGDLGDACRTAADCAERTCVQGRCARVEVQPIDDSTLSPRADIRTLLGAATVGPSTAFVIHEERNGGPQNLEFTHDVLLFEYPDRPAVTVYLRTSRFVLGGEVSAAVSLLGLESSYLVATAADRSTCSGESCGIHVDEYSPSGELLHTEAVTTSSDETVVLMRMARADDGRIELAAMGIDGWRGFVRGADGRWQANGSGDGFQFFNAQLEAYALTRAGGRFHAGFIEGPFGAGDLLTVDTYGDRRLVDAQVFSGCRRPSEFEGVIEDESHRPRFLVNCEASNGTSRNLRLFSVKEDGQLQMQATLNGVEGGSLLETPRGLTWVTVERDLQTQASLLAMPDVDGVRVPLLRLDTIEPLGLVVAASNPVLWAVMVAERIPLANASAHAGHAPKLFRARVRFAR